ncbi:hypothetical protein CDAR_114961 [Caerostris darwini]|uniref:Uncharacterized protein n=1 Tax=Caerostris darwini TaxID=1538125 RepID=A0AAV4WFU7_9ARAC|nr:hypothetical protein CDAR_114961 [Caerostris darwini]
MPLSLSSILLENYFKTNFYFGISYILRKNFICDDTFETYLSKKPPFFAKGQMIYVASCFIVTDHIERRTWNLCLLTE